MSTPAPSNLGGSSLPNAKAFAATAGSPTPLPKSLQGIYAKWGRWEEYSEAEGYRKRPCLVRLKHGGRVMGPCWPNAGKFTLMDGNLQWPEAVVEAVCYAESAEESEIDKLCEPAPEDVR